MLSKHVASMEEEVGVKFFSRDSHHVRLTDGGKVFLDDAKVIVESYDRALERIDAFTNSYEANVRIGYLRNASKPFLPKFVQQLTTRYPRVNVRFLCMEYGELHNAIISRKVDLGFTIDLDPLLRESCEVCPIYEDRFDAIVGSNHPLAGCPGVTSDMLAGHKLILPDSATYPGMDDFVRSLLPDRDAFPEVTYYQDVDTLYPKVQFEGYLGFSSEHNKAPFSDQVRFLPILDKPTGYNVSAMWLKGSKREGIDQCLDVIDACRP